MDIEYLLWLQNFREATNNVFTPFMELVSHLEMWFIFAAIFVYWTISKRKGFFIILAFCISCFMNGVLKLIFCIYRPFVLDERIIPLGYRPTSYSFPSGHAMSVTPVLGGLAVISRKKALWFACICVLFVVLTGLSRNYYGVHTLLDVVVGTLLGVLSLWIASVIVSHPERETLSYAIILVICAVCLYYISTKSYPEKYEGGNLIAGSGDNLRITFYEAGMIAGLISGRLIERKYIDFSPGLSVKYAVIAFAGLCVYSMFTFGRNFVSFLNPFITEYGGTFISGFVAMLYIAAIWPFVIKKVCNAR
ncbi:MAG: phosphatase PAP2 family protein [Synergistaceae bacterium]|nr:phosphatase PAP2 family protein [Synergistaceae bacterium]